MNKLYSLELFIVSAGTLLIIILILTTSPVHIVVASALNKRLTMKFKYQESNQDSTKYLVGIEGSLGGFHPRYNPITVNSETEAIDSITLYKEIYGLGRHDKMMEIQKALNSK